MYKKSSFKYWFAHWCAFNMTALNLGCWRFRFLFHDWEKPWLLLLLRDYEKVRDIHRKYSRHHLECIYPKDYLALVIDWECSRFTKSHATLNAREKLNSLELANKKDIETVLNKLNL